MVSATVTKLSDYIYVLRADDNETTFFEGLWAIPEGITYNAYLIKLDGATVLIDGWPKDYGDDFVNYLSRITNLEDIDYIIVNHMEPDHSGSLPKVLEANKWKATVLGHPMAKGLIESLLGISPKFRAVKDGERVEIGGRKFRFIHTPWLHWPETIMTFLEEDGILFPCDGFGGFSIPPTVFDDDEEVVKNYMRFVRKYFVSVIGYYRDFVTRAIDKLKSIGVEPKIIAPGHGLIWRKSLDIVDHYYAWAKAVPEKGKIAVIYTSMYGYVENSVSYALNELRERGLKTVVFRFTSRHRDSLSDLLGEVDDAEGIILGTATYEADVYPFINYVIDILTRKVKAKKPILILTTYGWGDVAGRKLETFLKEKGYEVVDVIRFKGIPSSEDREKIREGIEKFLKSL